MTGPDRKGKRFRCLLKRGRIVTKKEKPAEREMLTAGVEGVDTLDAAFKHFNQSLLCVNFYTQSICQLITILCLNFTIHI